MSKSAKNVEFNDSIERNEEKTEFTKTTLYSNSNSYSNRVISHSQASGSNNNVIISYKYIYKLQKNLKIQVNLNATL